MKHSGKQLHKMPIPKSSKKQTKSTSSKSKPDIKPETQIKVVKSLKSLKRRITHKSIRKFTVDRTNKILDILPQFIKFYDSLDNDYIMAVKYYKVSGSFFQSSLLTYKPDRKNTPRKLFFPFSYYEDYWLYNDILGKKTLDLLPFSYSIDITQIDAYIKKSYNARLTLLNRLDEIYNMKKCPRMIGEEILFRGMHSIPEIHKLKVGDSYLFENFISTTVDREVAERFSGGDDSCIFVLQNMKDIPFLYMPGNKLRSDEKYSKFIGNLPSIWDLSEYTLPRKLEFIIERIEYNYKSSSFTHQSIQSGKYSNLLKVLKKRGLLSSSDTDSKDEDKKSVVEENIFPKVKFIYCTFKSWHPRELIKWENISKDAEFVLDKDAINSWKEEICTAEPKTADGTPGFIGGFLVN
jgi:hypothetical protein